MNIKKLNEKLEKILETDWKKLQSNDDSNVVSVWKDHIYKFQTADGKHDFVVATSHNMFRSILSADSYSNLNIDELVDTGKTIADLETFLSN